MISFWKRTGKKTSFIKLFNELAVKSNFDFDKLNQIKSNLYGYLNFLEDLDNHTITQNSELWKHKDFSTKMISKTEIYSLSNEITIEDKAIDVLIDRIYSLMIAVHRGGDGFIIDELEKNRAIRLANNKMESAEEKYRKDDSIEVLKGNMMKTLTKPKDDYSDLG